MNAASLLLLLTQRQSPAVYLLRSKAFLSTISTWAVRGLFLCVISATDTCATWESQIISLWITCPLCITGEQPDSCKHTHTHTPFFSAGISGSVPLLVQVLRAKFRSWFPSCGIWADRVWLKWVKGELQGEVGLVKTALHTSPPSPIYLQIMFHS